MKSEVINIKTPVSRVGNKTAILHILYALFPLHYGRFIDLFQRVYLLSVETICVATFWKSLNSITSLRNTQNA